MLYIIDKENFEGTVEVSMPNGIRTKYTGLTLKEFRELKNNPRLITVTPEEFELMRDKYIDTLITPLREINEDEYFGIFRERKLYTGTLDKGFACFFFGEAIGFGIYDCFCELDNRYYAAKKKISITRKEIENEVRVIEAQEKPRKEVFVYDLESSSHDTILFSYLRQHYISNLTELFDQDTCKIRIRGYDYPFIRIGYEDKVFIIYIDTLYDIERKELETILFLFFSDGHENHFTKKYSLWSEYGEGCIAFKQWGQSTYAIWQYNGELPKEKTIKTYDYEKEV